MVHLLLIVFLLESCEFCNQISAQPIPKKRRMLFPRSNTQACEQLADIVNFDMLPFEMQLKILSYIKFPAILACRSVNHVFNELITGYPDVGVVGVRHRPTYTNGVSLWKMKKTTNFRNRKLMHFTDRTIPSFFFYQLMRKVKYLPSIFWPWLKFTKVEKLVLDAREVSSEKPNILSYFLPQSSTKKLTLTNLQDDQKIHTLFRCFASTKLKNIDLGGSQMEAQRIANLLWYLQVAGIQKLSLENASLSPKCIKLLGGGLRACSSLKKLNLGKNYLTHKGIKKLGICLPDYLEELGLSDNLLGLKGIRYIGEWIPTTKIRRLDLSGNSIGMIGMKYIARWLPQTKIQYLNLSYNGIRDPAAIIFASRCRTNNLEILDLSHNGITFQGFLTLFTYFSTTKLRVLYLNHNSFNFTMHLQEAVVNLPPTNLRRIALKNTLPDFAGCFLTDYKMATELKYLLRKKFPQVKWEF